VAAPGSNNRLRQCNLIVGLNDVIPNCQQQSVLSSRRTRELARISQPAKPNAPSTMSNEIHWPA
jgi:hypothetical protein